MQALYQLSYSPVPWERHIDRACPSDQEGIKRGVEPITDYVKSLPAARSTQAALLQRRRVSTVVVQRFCKPKAGGSNPSPGTRIEVS